MIGHAFIVAEVGSVHDGSQGNARKLIELASECGADAVKFQTHIASAETIRNAPLPSYFSGEPRYEYFERTGFSMEQWVDLKSHADEVGIEFMSSPFSEQAVELLEDIGTKRYKVPSGEVTNTPLLEKIAGTNKPVLLSSGMSSWEELDRAVEVLRRGDGPLTVMQCTSAYPCPSERVGLNVLQEMRERWNLPVGLSDHTLDNYAAFAAVALGACVIEKHLTFSRYMYGSDAPHSCEPEQFRELVTGVREISKIISNPVDKNDLTAVAEMKEVFEKSVVALTNIRSGELITPSMVTVKKPGSGIPAKNLRQVIGSRARVSLVPDQVVMPNDIVWDDKDQEY